MMASPMPRLGTELTCRKGRGLALLTWGGVGHGQLGRTERVSNASSTSFATTLEVDYFFERLQKMKFAVYG